MTFTLFTTDKSVEDAVALEGVSKSLVFIIVFPLCRTYIISFYYIAILHLKSYDLLDEECVSSYACYKIVFNYDISKTLNGSPRPCILT